MLTIWPQLRRSRLTRLLLTGLILLNLFFIAACGGSGGGGDNGGNGDDDPLGDMGGTWVGTWVSGVTTGLDGSFEARVVQSGSTLSGGIDIPFIGMDDAPLTGSVSGSNITFGDIDRTITFTGTVSGDRSSGTFSMPSYGQSGTWTADRTTRGDGDNIDDTATGLDASFGSSGVVVTDLRLTPMAVAVQSTGRILIAGDPTPNYPSVTEVRLVAITEDGRMDGVFGNEGILATAVSPTAADRVCGLALDDDDNIYLCAQAGEETLALLRYHSYGEPDLDFGIDGQIQVTLNPGETTAGITLAVDNKLLVAGYDSANIQVRRFLADGSVDTGFGTAGETIVEVSGIERVADIAVDNGRILVSGTADSDLFILALTDSGEVDTDWAGGGMTRLDEGSADEARDMALLSDGRIVVAAFGVFDWRSPKTAFLAVHRSDGIIDDSFGIQGICGLRDLDNGVAPLFDAYLQIAVDGDDRITAAGIDTNLFLVARWDGDGQLDASFGGDGLASADFGSTGGWDHATAVAVQPDDKILVAGIANSVKLVVARYQP